MYALRRYVLASQDDKAGQDIQAGGDWLRL